MSNGHQFRPSSIAHRSSFSIAPSGIGGQRVFPKLENEREMAIGTDGGAGVCSGGGEKRKRVDERGDLCEAVDRISALPDELRQHILTHLALKDAIRTGALARGWRDLWRGRWAHRASVEVHAQSSYALQRELDALALEPRPRRHLDRFSVVVETSKLKSSELRRFTEYAAECRVEDLHIEVRKSSKLNFHLPLSSLLLARLTLRHISISSMYYKDAQPFHALEVIRLYSVRIKVGFDKIMALCPSLITLDLYGCHFDIKRCWIIHWNLRRVTVAECDGYTGMCLACVPRLASFRYNGGCLGMPYIVRTGLAYLYIRFTDPVKKVNDTLKYHSLPKKLLSGLNVLTICCNALPLFSSLAYIRQSAPSPSLNLHGLKELQLLMLEMEAVNLADLYVFLKACQCPNLERLFVQLPTFKYLPVKGSIDKVSEEPPKDGLGKLVMIKVTNFSWCCIEVQLISFLLRKASSLLKLLIISPNVTPLDLPGVQEASVLLLKEALASGKVVVRDFDDGATEPYHSEVFTKL